MPISPDKAWYCSPIPMRSNIAKDKTIRTLTALSCLPCESIVNPCFILENEKRNVMNQRYTHPNQTSPELEDHEHEKERYRQLANQNQALTD